jgi:hypothetical protein
MVLNRASVALICQVMTVDVDFFDECFVEASDLTKMA